jgi:uncharacterized protein (TIGR02678 family)
MSRPDTPLAEAQSAFVGLLARPLLTASTDQELHRLVRRHQRRLTDWCQRCDYRLVAVGGVFRLHRSPATVPVAHPAVAEPPSRRELVLTLVAAAALEEVDATTTIQGISDAVRAASASPGCAVETYDPDRRTERALLVRALERLEELGVLRRRTHDDELVRVWQDDAEGIGRGYQVDRDACLLLLDPAAVASVLAPPRESARPLGADPAASPGETDQGLRTRLLRRLVETQALLVAELTPAERAVWPKVQHLVCRDAETMTGGTAEARAEGVVLILPPDRRSSAAATVDWPRAATSSWVALLVLDAAVQLVTSADAGAAGAVDDVGVAHLPDEAVEQICAAIHERWHDYLTKALKADASEVRTAAETELVDVGLLTVTAEGWQLAPSAARYRAPTVTAVTSRVSEVVVAQESLLDV